jgi:hypothetical protein
MTGPSTEAVNDEPASPAPLYYHFLALRPCAAVARKRAHLGPLPRPDDWSALDPFRSFGSGTVADRAMLRNVACWPSGN